MAGNPHGVTGPWLFLMWAETHNNRFRLHAGPRGGLEGFVAETGQSDAVKIREASYGRIRLVSVEHLDQGGTSLVWQDTFHEVSTFVHGTDVSLDVLVSMLSPLEIKDSREGIVVRPRRGTGAKVEYTLGANFVPEIGTVTVKPLELATEQVPRAGGRAMSGGHLWRDDDVDADGKVTQRTLLLANETTATFLVPFDPDQAELVPLIESIKFSLA